MHKDSITYKILKNSAYSLVGFLWPIFFSIFITPIIVYKLGVEDYGLYILLVTINNFVGLLELGLNASLIKYISQYQSSGDVFKLKRLIYSVNSLFWIIGMIGFVLYLVLGLNAQIFSLPEGRSYLPYFIVAGLSFFVSGIISVFSVVPVAMQRFDINTKLGIIQLTVSNLVLFFLVKIGFGLMAILLSQLVISIFYGFALFYFSKKLLPWMGLKFNWSINEIKESYKFGFLVFISNAASASFNQLDRIIIPIFLGPSSLTYYSLPGNVSSKISGTTNSITSIVFPLTSSLQGDGDSETIKKIYTRTIRLVTVVAAAMTSVLVFYSYQVLYYWVGKEFADKGSSVLVILAFTFFLLAIYAPLLNFLFGLGKSKFLAFGSVAMAVTNLILLIILLPKLNILGAAWSYLGASLFIIYMFYYTEVYYLNLNSRLKFYIILYGKIIVTTTVFYIVSRWLLLPWISSLGTLMLTGMISGVLYFIFYWLFGFFDQEDVQSIKNFFVSFMGKIGIFRKIFKRI